VHMRKWVVGIVLVLFLTMGQVSLVTAEGPVVHAVLFYSPTCPHCHTVITEVLPPLIQLYGGEPEVLYIPPPPEEEPVGPSLVGIFGKSLEILYVNVYTQLGQELYQSAVKQLNIPPELQAVPTMIVDDYLLIGGIDIPEQLPGIIEEGIANGGIDWINLPGLLEAINRLIPAPTEIPTTEEPTQEVTESTTTPETTTEVEATDVPPTATEPAITNPENPTDSLFVSKVTLLDRIKLDPAGNIVAIVVLIGMVISVAAVSSRLVFPDEAGERQIVSWLIPVLSVIGIGIAAYLTYVETSGVKAVCGPVGDCNTVQESRYAILFGILPVGALGIAGYIGIVLAWLLAKLSDKPWNQCAELALLVMSLFGTLFSIYLTFLEPFVIGATCMWCVTSAIIMTLLMWLTTGPATAAISELRGFHDDETDE
jgi:uncharacterized membrane protein